MIFVSKIYILFSYLPTVCLCYKELFFYAAHCTHYSPAGEYITKKYHYEAE